MPEEAADPVEAPPTECPKCGYQRQAHDIAPLTECARCGIIFAKFLARAAAPAASAASAPRAGASIARSEAERRSSIARSEAERRSSIARSEAERRSSIARSEAERRSSIARSEAERRSSTAPTSRQGLLARLFYVPDKVDGMDVAGRAALWALLLVWGGSFLRFPYFSQKIGESFLHRVHLVFHEAGHVLFMPFGRFMHILGGSLFQCLWPLILGTAAVVRQRHPFAGAVCLWWCGHAILDVAPYIADARILDMPLLGETSDEDADLRAERHDWHNLLIMLGWLERDLRLARGCYWMGACVMGLALLWGAWLLWQQRQRVAAGYVSPEE